MRIVLAIALAAASAGHGGGQEPPRRDPRMQTLVLDAAGTPPEFEADALLRIAGSSRVDAAWRRELIDAAFMRAYGAQEPYRRSSTGVPPDTRQGALLAAFDTRMNQISLQARAAQMMALVDGPHARELFQWMQPGVEASSCGDVFVPSMGEYYSTLSLLARTTYPEAERGEAMRFLEYYLWRAHLPSEMPSVTQAMQRFKPSTGEAAYLETVLRFIFEGGVRDPRGFSVSNLDIISRVGELEDADVEIGVMGRTLSRSLRDYLKAYLTGARCADSASEPVAADAFNARIRRTEVIKDGVPTLEGADVRPSSVLPGARLDFFWQTSDSRRLQQEYLRLRGSGKDPLPYRQRLAQSWREQAERFITDLDHWNGVREGTTIDYFYEKAVLFTEILVIMPPSGVRTHGLRSFIDFLRHADMDRNRRALWFLFTNRLIELSQGPDREFILDAMEASGHSTLSLYARLERILPQQNRTRPGPQRGEVPLTEERRHP